MWKLCIEDDQSKRTVVNLVRKEYTIGRAESNSIRLTERNISRQHARLSRTGTGWLLEDLNSSTGSFVNDQQLVAPHELKHADKVRLGDYSLQLTDQEQPEEPVPRAGETATVRAIPRSQDRDDRNDRLIVVEGPTVGMSYKLSSRRQLIGRGDECDISLADTSVSRIHIDIERMPGGTYRVEDQESSNGLRVNGQEVASAMLSPGDVIELGDVLLTFIPRGHVYRPGQTKRPDGNPRTADLMLQASRNPKLLLGALAIGLIAGGVLFLATSDEEEPPAAQAPSNPAAKAVERAVALVKEGDIEAAHRALSEVPTSSNLRQTSVFREIETLWADHLFSLAHATDDGIEERRLLREIAAAPSVDGARRKQASDALDELSKRDLAPTDLPPEVNEEPGPPDAADAEMAAPHRPSKPTVRSKPVKGPPREIAAPPTALAPLESEAPDEEIARPPQELAPE